MAKEAIRTWVRGKTMVLKNNRKEDFYESILIQLSIAVAKRNYTPPMNHQEKQKISDQPQKRFVKASKTSRFRIGMFRTTKPHYNGIEEIIAEEAILIHENIGINKPINKQKIKCHMTELQTLKEALEKIENNILP